MNKETAAFAEKIKVKKTPAISEEKANALLEELKKTVRGEVHFDEGYKGMYATDASNYRQVPIGVVLPLDKNDIKETIAACRKYQAPVLSRGGGTSLAGQCCNTAVVLDLSKYYNRILDFNPEGKTIRVQPGIVLDNMQAATLEYGLIFGPDPATHSHCTLGGMIGNNSCGVHSVLSQFITGGTRTSDFIKEMKILTYDGVEMTVGKTSEKKLENIIRQGGRKGEIYAGLKAVRDKYADLIRKKFPDIPRRVSGFNIDDLLPENGFNVARALSGSEGTCATVLEATLELVPKPKKRSLLMIGYPDVFEAGDHVPEIMQYKPTGLEGMDDELIGYMKKRNLHTQHLHLFPSGKGWLIAEFGGETEEEAGDKARAAMKDLKKKRNPPPMEVYDKEEEQDYIWEVRESGLGATAFVPGMKDTWPGWEDSAVHPDHVGAYLRDLRKLFKEYGYSAALYGHFGQGCIHCRIDFGLQTKEDLEKYKEFTNEAADLVLRYGGSFSGEHGDGQARGELLEKMFGPELMQAFREFKNIWDPHNKMNPGKVIDPFPRTENLRLGPDYNPLQPETVFQFPEDNGSFSRATKRCVGVGKCRRHHGGIMCPSYMVTKEEKHTTRGRARLLFEMLENDVVSDQWKSEDVKESLDLCLSCKGCVGDCPVNVDIATYKAEFLYHYYKTNPRPRNAYLFGLIHKWARLGGKMPKIANFFTQTPGFSQFSKSIVGIPQKRSIPAFASQTFTSWYKELSYQSESKKKVLLWPDTFNNHFYPEVLKAGLNVLGQAGYYVIIPETFLCCGRPLYEFGMLKTAKKQLQKILKDLKNEIRNGIPLVGLEPSCLAVFRDELKNLFPNDMDATRLHKQSYTLAEFLNENSENYTPPKINKKGIMHQHCHHHAIMGTSKDIQLLEKTGMDLEVLDSGCCGMAGSFGFEKGEKYEVSVKAGERVLFPAVRNAGKDQLIIADGFSCREQISQGTGKKPLHLAQILYSNINK